jgi:heavy metal sensor kinase
MFRSIRWTLLLWHAAILMLALIGFGTATYYGISRARYTEVDAELAGELQAIAAKLHTPRPPPPPRRRGPEDGPRDGQPRDDRPPEDRPPDDGPPDQRQNRENDLPPSFLERFGDGGNDLPYFVLFRSNGEISKSSSPRFAVPDPGQRTMPIGTGPPMYRRRGDLREAGVMLSQGERILVGRSTRREQGELRRLAWMLAGVGGGMLAIGLAGGWMLSRRIIRPIRAIGTTAEAISASNLSGRIDTADTASELVTLADVLNAMFERLESSFQQQARFTADASHELRTPVAVIHSHAELALSRERSAEEYRNTIRTCLRASGRMKGLIESLLLLARADGGKLELDSLPIDLGQIAEESIALVGPLAEEKTVTLESNVPPTEITGDPVRLAQVVTNLLTNAIRYNREGGQVRVSVSTEDHHATLTVADTGVGIPEADRAHVFDRFYRVDKHRSREAGGSGLGLAICKTIVEAHGGTITLTGDGTNGTNFTVRLPLRGSSS